MTTFAKMNPVVKAIWIDALTDPNTKQTTGCLRDSNDRMCCLGVLTEKGIEAGVKVTRELKKTESNYIYRWTDEDGRTNSTDGVLPDPIMEWAGLNMPDPYIYVEPIEEIYDADDGEHPYYDDRGKVSASICNDQKRFNFEQIAELVKENL